MNRKAHALGHLLTLALVVVIGFGAYSYSLKHQLDATMVSFGALEQDRNLWKSKAEAAKGLVDGASSSLNQCSAQVDELKSRLILRTPAG